MATLIPFLSHLSTTAFFPFNSWGVGWVGSLWLVLRSLGILGLWSVLFSLPLLLLVQDIIICLFPIYSLAIAICHLHLVMQPGINLSHLDPESSKRGAKYFSHRLCHVFWYSDRLPAKWNSATLPDFKCIAFLFCILPDCLHCNNSRLLSEVDTSVKDCFEEFHRFYLS